MVIDRHLDVLGGRRECLAVIVEQDDLCPRPRRQLCRKLKPVAHSEIKLKQNTEWNSQIKTVLALLRLLRLQPH